MVVDQENSEHRALPYYRVVLVLHEEYDALGPDADDQSPRPAAGGPHRPDFPAQPRNRPHIRGLSTPDRLLRPTPRWAQTERSRHDHPGQKTTASAKLPQQRGARHTTARGEVLADTAGRTTALLRITTGLLFLWAFADKAFGLGYSTTTASAWFNGGSPTRGFLSNIHSGPFAEQFRALAGNGFADLLFMLGLLAIGVAVTIGAGLRISAVTGTLMMALMWAAEWPPAQFTDAGELTRSTNPLIDYHVIYALVLIALAAVHAGNTWGPGRHWARLTGTRHWLR